MACTVVLHSRPLIRPDVAVAAHTDLAPSPRAAPLGRMFVREHLAHVLPLTVLNDVLLLTSELVTNAVLHGRTEVHLGVAYDEKNVMVSVQDRCPAMPQQRQAISDELTFLAESGRGMTLIASLADDFGWDRSPIQPGKVMWFVVGIPAQTHAESAPADGMTRESVRGL